MARDCEGFSRRDFLKVGSAGLLGLTLAATAETGIEGPREPRRRRQPTRQGQHRHHGLARRRPGHHRHVGPEAQRPRRHPRRIPRNQHLRRRRPDLRTPAEDGPRHGTRTIVRSPGSHHPVARPGHGLHDHRQQADPGDPISRARLAGHPLDARRRRRAALRQLHASSATAPPARPATSAPPTTRSSSKAHPASATAAPMRRPPPILRVRGITLPTGFTLEELENRDHLLAELRQHLPERRSQCRPGRRPRRLPQAGARNPPLRQDQERLRPGPGTEATRADATA